VVRDKGLVKPELGTWNSEPETHNWHINCRLL